jgi:fructose-specific phosphotransferase system IIC component
MTVGIYSFQAGAGPFGAIVAGFVTAGLTFVVGQYAVSVARSPLSAFSFDCCSRFRQLAPGMM